MMPYAGPVPGMNGVWAAYGWHGNGVSMASYAANRLAGVIAGKETHEAALVAGHAPATGPVRFASIADGIPEGCVCRLCCSGQMALTPKVR
jgi:glycine/D-amino acid oxidase-like deaminating enzyme